MNFPFSFSLPQRLALLPVLLWAGAAGAMPGAPASGAPGTVTKPMVLNDYMALSGPAPSGTFTYGAAPSQFAELFRPKGSGPFPVAVVVHGGCWTKEYGGIVQMRNLAGALVEHGIAVWNVEYRRVDEEGGGYPGTYQDVDAALSLLASQAKAQQLDLQRIVAIGHSAGGQLVQWIAGRSRIAASSPLYRPGFLPVKQIISLGGLADLRKEQALLKTSCDRDVAELTGQPSAARPDVFSDTNAAELMPNGAHTVLINGEHDTVSPPRVAEAYAARARAAGDSAEVIILPGASHYDEVAPASAAFALILPVIQKALGRAVMPLSPQRNK